MNVVDFNTERTKRKGPDNEFMQVIDGKHWFLFSASFTDGVTVANVMFWATGTEEAKRQVEIMRRTMILDGQIYQRLGDDE